MPLNVEHYQLFINHAAIVVAAAASATVLNFQVVFVKSMLLSSFLILWTECQISLIFLFFEEIHILSLTTVQL